VPNKTTPRTSQNGLIDFSSLRRTFGRDDVGRYRKWALSAFPDLRSGFPYLVGLAVSVLVMVTFSSLILVFAAFLVVILWAVAVTYFVVGSTIPESGYVLGSLIALPVQLVIALLTFWVFRLVLDSIRRDGKFQMNWQRSIRLTHFANANGLTHTLVQRNPVRSGAIFQAGTTRRSRDVLDGAVAFRRLRRGRGG